MPSELRIVIWYASSAILYLPAAKRRRQNPESRALVPGIAFGDFARRFREPKVAEGFEDVVRVEFRFRGDEQARRVWGQYWI